jgi:hypothetical protein
VQNSAQGYVRLSVGLGDYMDFWDAFLMMFRIIVSIGLFAAPAFAHLYLKSEAEDIPDFIFNFLIITSPTSFLLSARNRSGDFFDGTAVCYYAGISYRYESVYDIGINFKNARFLCRFYCAFLAGIVGIKYINLYCYKLFGKDELAFMLALGAYRFIKIYLYDGCYAPDGKIFL